ncbi:hypothetical protein [Agrobacterium sp. CG674]
MSMLTFILMNAAFMAIDGAMTFVMSNATELSIAQARLISCTITLVVIGFSMARPVPPRASSDSPSRTLAAIISALGTGLSCGLFILILSRNPMLQWPAAFAASAFASLIFASLAYRRAQRR